MLKALKRGRVINGGIAYPLMRVMRRCNGSKVDNNNNMGISETEEGVVPSSNRVWKLIGGGNGSFTMFKETGIAPNDDVPLHIHPKSQETFYITKGTFKSKVGDDDPIIIKAEKWYILGNVSGMNKERCYL